MSKALVAFGLSVLLIAASVEPIALAQPGSEPVETELGVSSDEVVDEGSNAEPSDEPAVATEETGEPEEPAPGVDEAILEEPGEEPGEGFDALANSRNSGAAVPAGTYLIRPAISSIRVLDIASASRDNYANVRIYQSNMTGAQRFAVSVDANGYYVLTNANSGKVLDVDGAGTVRGTNIHQYAPNGTSAQKWSLRENSDGSYVIESAIRENLVLDVANGNDLNGSNIQVWDRNGTQAQSFFFIPLSPSSLPSSDAITNGLYSISTSLPASRVLDIASASPAAGVALQLWDSNATKAQRFYIHRGSDGLYALRPLHSALALGTQGSNLVATTPVVQLAYDPASLTQRWAIRSNPSDGTVSFINAGSGLYLDVANGSPASGAKLTVYYSNGTVAQKFRLTSQTMPLDFSEGVFTIIPQDQASKRIDIANGSTAPGANAQAYVNNNTLAQKFLIVNNGDGSYSFSGILSGLYLTEGSGNVFQDNPSSGAVPAASQRWIVKPLLRGVVLQNKATNNFMTLVGNDIRTVAFTGGDIVVDAPSNLIFTFSLTPAVVDGSYTITSAIGDRALEVTAGSLATGANVQIYQQNGTGAQTWNIVQNSDGTAYITNGRSSRVLDVADGSPASGANVQQWTLNHSAAQKWKITPCGDGLFTIGSGLGTNLDVAGGGDYDGCNVIASAKNGNRSQKFKITAAPAYLPAERLNGVDVSSHQPANIGDLIDYDFLIVKATEGTTYTNPNMQQQADSALRRGKRLGFYHFAQTGNPEAEARFFVSRVGNYLGKAALILDYEAAAIGNGREWVRRFMQEVKRQTGVTCGVYASSFYANLQQLPLLCSEEGSYLWNANYPLSYTTIEGYRHDLTPGAPCRIFQYTSSGRLPGYSGNLDLNMLYGNSDIWAFLCLRSR